MRQTIIMLLMCFSTAIIKGQTQADLINAAQQFPAMPQSTVGLLPFVQGQPTFSSGAPYNDIEFTIFDTDYMDGENSGSDVFMPVDPSDAFPGSDFVKYVKPVLNTDLNENYGAANADKIILGTHEIAQPFFLKGSDNVDNDYCVVQNFDYESGYIQLKGTVSDYSLLFADETVDGVNTTGYYLFYTADGDIDLVAFIFPCDVLASTISGNPPQNPTALCNGSGTLSLTDTNNFRFAQPLSTTIAEPNGIVQYGSNGKEVVSGITADSQGNIYLFGLTDGNLDGNADSRNEVFIAKIDDSGLEQWVTEIELPEGSILKDGTTDSQYVYLAGRTLGALPGYTNAGKWDAIILKLDLNTGDIVATDQFGSSGIDGYGNITLDDNGNLFVSAQGAPTTSGGGTDKVYLVAKHSAATLANIWRVIEEPQGNVVASAEAWGGITYAPGANPGDGRLVIGGWFFAPQGADAFVAVYDNLNSTSPVRSSTANIASTGGGPRADWVLDNAVDSQGNIYVAGYTTGSLNGAILGEGDAYITKYDANLSNPVTYQFGTNKSELVRKLEIDDNDVLYAVGFTNGDLYGNNADVNNASGDIFVQKFDTNLNLLENTQFGTPHEDRLGATLKNGLLYIGGMTEGSFVETSLGSFDGYGLALNPSDLSIVDATLSIDSIPEIGDFSIYPNPTSGNLYVESPYAEAYDYKLFDLQGRLVLNGTVEQGAHIDTSILQSGTYVVSLTNDKESIIQQIIKN